MINWHNIKMIVLIGVTFLIAGVQAIHGMTPLTERLDILIPVLTFIQHMAGGNTAQATTQE